MENTEAMKTMVGSTWNAKIVPSPESPPPAAPAGRGHRVPLEHEVDPALATVHARHPHADRIPDPVHPSALLPHQAERPLVEVVEVVAEGAHVDEPFHEHVVGEHEEAEGRHVGDATGEVIAQVALHVLDLLEVHAVALGLVGHALAPAEVLRESGQRILGPRLPPIGSSEEPGGEDAVDMQIGVASDR